MKSSLKKSLFVGLAALGFVAVAGSANANTASAKSYAKVTSNKALATDATTRNVNVNGTNALYTKAGTLKGAKTVATKSTLAALKDNKTGQKNWRAYRVATTNRGSVYYKVVSFDKTYRGWIYGGKSTAAFAGGIAQYNTTTAPTANPDANGSVSSSASINTQNQTTGLSATQKAATYKITNAGTANDGTATTYTYPAWTEYKKGRVATDATPYKDDTFKVVDQTTRTREGDLWVKIQDTNAANATKINGWIKYSALTATTTPAPTPSTDWSKALTFNYVDSATNKVVGTAHYAPNGVVNGQLVNATNDGFLNTSTGFIYTNVPAGYNVNSNTLVSGTALYAQLAAAKFGDTFNIPVNVNNNLNATQLRTVFEGIQIQDLDNNGAVVSLKSFVDNANASTANTTQLNQAFYARAEGLFITNSNLNVPNNGTVKSADFKTALKAAHLDNFVVAQPKTGETVNNAVNGTVFTLKAVNNVKTSDSDSDVVISIDPVSNANSALKTPIYLHYNTKSTISINHNNNTTPNHGAYGQDDWTGYNF